MYHIKCTKDGFFFEADFAGYSFQKEEKGAYKFKTKQEAQNCIDGLSLQDVEIVPIQ